MRTLRIEPRMVIAYEVPSVARRDFVMHEPRYRVYVYDSIRRLFRLSLFMNLVTAFMCMIQSVAFLGFRYLWTLSHAYGVRSASSPLGLSSYTNLGKRVRGEVHFVAYNAFVFCEPRKRCMWGPIRRQLGFRRLRTSANDWRCVEFIIVALRAFVHWTSHKINNQK